MEYGATILKIDENRENLKGKMVYWNGDGLQSVFQEDSVYITKC